MYQKVHEAGKLLSSTADTGAQGRIKSDLSLLEKQWLEMIGTLDTRKEWLEGVLHMWEETEEGMEDTLAWLKQIRHEVTRDLPSNYDQLQQALQQCQVHKPDRARNGFAWMLLFMLKEGIIINGILMEMFGSFP